MTARRAAHRQNYYHWIQGSVDDIQRPSTGPETMHRHRLRFYRSRKEESKKLKKTSFDVFFPKNTREYQHKPYITRITIVANSIGYVFVWKLYETS